jgi:hypothetical protein
MKQLSIQKFNDVMLDVYAKNQMDLLDKVGDFTVTYMPDTEEIEVKFKINISKKVLINGDITNCIKFKLDFHSIQKFLNSIDENKIDIVNADNRKYLAKMIEMCFDDFKQLIGCFNGVADDCEIFADFLHKKKSLYNSIKYGLTQ